MFNHFDVEYADLNSPNGCGRHEDPACLCDVDRDRFVVGDGPYVIPLFLEDLLMEGTTVEALVYETARRTLTKGMQDRHVQFAIAAIDAHGVDLLRAIRQAGVDGVSYAQVGRDWDVNRSVISHLAGLMGAKRRSFNKDGVKRQFMALIEDGMTPTRARLALNEQGVVVPRSTAHQWAFGRSDGKAVA